MPDQEPFRVAQTFLNLAWHEAGRTGGNNDIRTSRFGNRRERTAFDGEVFGHIFLNQICGLRHFDRIQRKVKIPPLGQRQALG